MNIRKCRWQECCGYEYCNAPECAEYDPGVMTNGDRIRAMTDEELAKAAANHIPLHSWPDAVRDIYFSHHVSKYGAWLEWVKAVKEDAGSELL